MDVCIDDLDARTAGNPKMSAIREPLLKTLIFRFLKILEIFRGERPAHL
jgi:hypothetical protein